MYAIPQLAKFCKWQKKHPPDLLALIFWLVWWAIVGAGCNFGGSSFCCGTLWAGIGPGLVMVVIVVGIINVDMVNIFGPFCALQHHKTLCPVSISDDWFPFYFGYIPFSIYEYKYIQITLTNPQNKTKINCTLQTYRAIARPYTLPSTKKKIRQFMSFLTRYFKFIYIIFSNNLKKNKLSFLPRFSLSFQNKQRSRR